MAIDQTVTRLYRSMLQTGFRHAGFLKDPSIFLDSKVASLNICDAIGRDFINIYININDNVIEDIKYMCSCDPAANVVIEAMCDLVKGKTLTEAKALKPELFFGKIGSNSETLAKKTKGLIEFINKGIDEFLNEYS